MNTAISFERGAHAASGVPGAAWLRRLGALALLAVAGCASPEPFDYRPLLDHMPGSILVLPPLNETNEPLAAEGWLATITRPLAERGYYVFPVAVVDRMLRENGLPTPWEMHQVSLGKLREVFGADAVLYVTVHDWGTEYQVLASVTRVAVTAQLIDLATGTELWRGQGVAARGSNSGNNQGLLGAAIGALVNQVVTSTYDPSPQVSREANDQLLGMRGRSLLPGPRHPDHAQVMTETRSGLDH